MKLFLSLGLLLACGSFSNAQWNAISGYATLNGGTTGGQGGETVYVSTEAELVAAVTGNDPRIVKITSLITLSDVVRPGSNKTILGASPGAGVTGSGFYIRRVQNVIVRGLQISYSIAPDDGVSIDEATNVWVDHNEFFADREHGKDYYDGQLDIKHAADWVTVSWNKFHDSYKTSLVGHSDSNAGEDTGKLHITYNNNWFTDVGSRLPSLRFGTGHIYNNLYERVDTSGINSRMGAQVLVERNIFIDVKTPLTTDLDSSQEGFAVERENDWGDSEPNITQEGSFTNPPYSYEMEELAQVAAVVRAGAGNTISFP
ncbi:pectate lyase A [Folsomia candida]|uniref:Pectate lyase A n=1 Tax=Folsomia candida TaxID=158441 RepID=A0A226E8B7_FOLCA|nr:pectate lyase A [Folsomia candida]OXA53792.1 Pectate lyase A [Folsomia candida]